MSDRQRCVTADRPEAKTETCFRFAGAVAAPTIPSTAVRAYLKMFQCIAVYVFGDGRVSVSADPFTLKRAPIAGIWWCSSPAQALAIKRQCEAEEISDVVSVAAGLRIGITSNAVAISRAQAAIARMHTLVDQAQQAGLMKMLNGRYREERMRARQRGNSFPPYATVHRRFVSSLYASPLVKCRSDRWSIWRSWSTRQRPHSQARAGVGRSYARQCPTARSEKNAPMALGSFPDQKKAQVPRGGDD
jgi:hypothetical protein